MQLKQEFIRTCDQLGLEDCEVALAEVIWQRAERAAWGLSKQVPSLLDNKEQQVKASLSIDMIEPEPCVNQELTQADVQMLTKILSRAIRKEQTSINYNKLIVRALWNKCNPEDSETKAFFDALNFYKEMNRSDEKKRAKLAALQCKLKKLQSLLGK